MVAAGWRVTAAVAVIVSAVAAAPLDSSHHDVKKSYPPEAGLDEEVRQLMDLKSLTAQRNLGLRQGEGAPAHLPSTPAPAPADSALPASANRDSHAGQVRQVVLQKSWGDRFNMANGVKDQHSHTDERVTSDGQMLRHTASDLERHQNPGLPLHSRQQVDLDLPAEGVHQTLLDEDGHRSLLSLDHKGPVRYSPMELALYVYKTGDEEGVVLAIQELIAEGLMTAEEALAYLHDIRENLHHVSLQEAQDKEIPSEFKSLVKKNELTLPLTEMNLGGPDAMLAPEPDYETMMERMRGSQDYAYTQYSLEEVIYQLAKILFKQAMHREGDMGSERALQEVAGLLEKEVARGAISPEVEKKVLDVMVNSLVDSLGENDFPSAPGPVIGGSNFRLPNEASFPMGSSPMIGGSNFKPSSDLFQLSKSTTKREAPEDKKLAENKQV